MPADQFWKPTIKGWAAQGVSQGGQPERVSPGGKPKGLPLWVNVGDYPAGGSAQEISVGISLFLKPSLWIFFSLSALMD